MGHTPFAVDVLEQRYLLREKGTNRIIETPEECYWRSASTGASVESEGTRDIWSQEFFTMMWDGDFLPNSPTLMNAGKKDGQLSACFVLPIEDSMEGIFTTLKDTALIHKTGGGTGFSFSSLRPEGSTVSNKSGVSTGPLAFCQVYDLATDKVKQGSSRRGANMMVFDVHHPEILQFIYMKTQPKVMENFNVSVAVTEEFMEALRNDGFYELRHPFTGPVCHLRASDVWNAISRCAWKSAEPGVLFIDEANKKSNFEEYLHSTNPCGEQWLPPYGACNLGSINLGNFVDDGAVQWSRLADTVALATRYLDNIIDANVYPLPQIEEKCKYYRNIGLGPMGWADALIKLGIPYGSPESIKMAHTMGSFINHHAHKTSIALGEEKGFPEGAPFKTHFSYSAEYRRNATLTNSAPTGTISLFARCSSGIEPNAFYVMTRRQADREVVDKHHLYEKAEKNGGIDERIFVEAHDVSWEGHVDMQAAWQQHVDNAISKTINLPESATVADIQNAYFRAYEGGCKGITVYRDGSRGPGILSNAKEKEVVVDACCEDPKIIAEDGCETCASCGVSKCAVA